MKLLKSLASYTWTINNFCICRKRTGEVIDSPIISAGADGEHRWRILLYPKGKNEEHREYLSIFLFLLTCNESKLDVQTKISIVNDKKKECNERRLEQQLHRGNGFGCMDFIKRAFLLDKANGLLPDGHLTIMIEISTGTGLSINHSNNHANLIHEMSPSEQCLSVDLEHLLEDKKYTDVTLSSHEQTFKAHKNILAARSSVFSKIFEVENKKTLELEDVNPEVLQEMLRFIYTGKVKNVSKSDSLLVVAENYKLEGLKAMCEDTLCKNLTVDNVVDTLILADCNKAERLKTHAISFIIAHAKDVIETPAYKLIAESHQLHLLAEVFRVLALQHH
ncbi:speckle-type POZ protein-like isoform X2 [Phymastichus coffea]|nr:speckle-type POZ protein-like isoform X2 [Phymastichus coffea]